MCPESSVVASSQATALQKVVLDPAEHEMLLSQAIELREILFDDASAVMQGAMVGRPEECLAFAIWWIQKAKGLDCDLSGQPELFSEEFMAHQAAIKKGWLPIETAPKDQTPVDLWRPSWGGERCTNMRRVDLGNGNVFYEPVSSGPSCVRDATHWMPIPQNP